MDDQTHYVGDDCPGGHADDAVVLAVELDALRAGIRARAAWWDRSMKSVCPTCMHMAR